MSRSGIFGAALLALSLTAFGEARADTYLSTCAANGVMVNANVTVAYDGLFPDPLDSKSGFDNDAVVLPGTIAFATSPPLSLFPDVGDPKPDMINAQASSRFEFGTPSGTTPLDTFEFVAAGDASALAAFNTAGSPADAVVSVKSAAEFFVDPAPVGTCPGKIELAALRSLLPYENKLLLTVTENPYSVPVIVAQQFASGPPMTVIVNPGNLYKIDFTYELRVPHGIDPPFGVTVPFSVEAIPPAPTMNTTGTFMLALMIGGSALLLGLRTRTRETGATHS